MNSYNITQTEITINKPSENTNCENTYCDETNHLIHPHRASIRNSAIPYTNDKLGACCYWSVVLGISGSIIGATIWSLIHYYS